MPDDTDLNLDGGQEVVEQEVDNNPELDTQDEPMPSSEQEDIPESDSLPEDANDRTKEQFEKLKESNRKLKEQLEAQKRQEEYGDSAYDYFGSGQPQDTSNLTQDQVDNIAGQFVQPDGTVDLEGFNRTIREANEKARAAEENARKAVQYVEEQKRQSQQQEVMEAHQKFPSLDPKSPEFDSNFYNLVVDRMVRNQVDGRRATLAQVAGDISQFYSSTPSKERTEQQKAKAVEEYKQTQTKKAQASSTGGSSQKREDTRSLDELRQRSKRGDRAAIMERVKLAGY